MTRPPPVVSAALVNGVGTRWCHRILPVLMSIALNSPMPSAAVGCGCIDHVMFGPAFLAAAPKVAFADAPPACAGLPAPAAGGDAGSVAGRAPCAGSRLTS